MDPSHPWPSKTLTPNRLSKPSSSRKYFDPGTLISASRSTEWASEEDRPSHRRARPETAPEQFGDPTRTEKLESASGGTIRSSTARGRSSSNTSSSLGGASRQHSAEIARMSSASESEAEEGGDSFARPAGKSGVKKPGVVRQKSAEDGRLPATERLFRG